MVEHPRGLPSHLASLDRCLVWGVLNVTPDSFSDGGRFASPDAAVAHGAALAAAGADVVDVGGESTRPGAVRIPVEVELDRVLPVVAGLAAAGVVVSIDTMRAPVAVAALAAGASVVNDVSGGLADPEMLQFVAGVDAPYVAMHWRGHSTEWDTLSRYDDVVDDVCAELSARLDACVAAGIDPARVVLDPGLGFAKESGHNWSLLGRFDRLLALGRPVLVGASRKRFLGALLADETGAARPVDGRDRATDAVSALAAAAGAWAVRVHDVRGSLDAVLVAAAWTAGARGGAAMTAPADRIRLAGLRATGYHGVFEHERRDGQEFVVDVDLDVDTRSAAAGDDLSLTVDYGTLARQVHDVVTGEPVRLIETLAQRIADVCLAHERVQAVAVTVHKPSAPVPVAFGDVTVRIVRSR